MEGFDFKKPVISLSDADRVEINMRLFFSRLSPREIEIIDELLHSSLNIALAKFCETVGQSPKQLLPFLEKLEGVGLFQIKNGVISVDKGKRKAFERHMIKFEEDFRTDIEYLKILLKTVPFESLVERYHVPQTSSDIFTSIIEGYFKAPKMYARYLQQIAFDDPVPKNILKDLFESEDLVLCADTVRKNYGLSDELFAELMLFLEYHLLCFSSYRLTAEGWEEIITPLYEWGQYLFFSREKMPQPIPMEVNRCHPQDFGFVQDLTSLVQLISNQSVHFESDAQIDQILAFSHSVPNFRDLLLKRLLALNLGTVQEGKLSATPLAAKWLQKSVNEQASILTRYALTQVSAEMGMEWQKVERDLKRVASLGWVFFDDFFSGLTVSLRGMEPVALQSQGKRWAYQLPKYTREDELRVRQAFLSYLFEGGIVALGHSQDRLCFCLTPFGYSRLGNAHEVSTGAKIDFFRRRQ